MHPQRHKTFLGIFFAYLKILVRALERHGGKQNLRTPYITGSLKYCIEVRLVVLLSPVDSLELIGGESDSNLNGYESQCSSSFSIEREAYICKLQLFATAAGRC